MPTPFVGRDIPLTRLNDAQRARSADHVVLVLGVAGIGKTTLLDAVRSAAIDEGTAVAWAVAGEWEGAPGLWPWYEAFTELDAVQTVVPRTPDPDLEPVDMAEMFRSVAQWLTDRGRRRDTLIIIEDLHAAHPTAVALFQYLARRPAIDGVTIIASARPGDDTIEATRCLQVTLGGLPAADVAALARLSGHPLDLTEAAALTRRTDGNPLFIQRLLDQGADPDAPLPSDIAALLRAEIDAVAAGARRLIDTLAVLGSTSIDLLEEMLGDDSARTTIEGAASGIVELRDDHVTFRHGLFRKVVYDRLDRDARFDLHSRAADALARRGESPITLAHHLSRAASSQRGLDAARAAREAAHVERSGGALREAAQNLTLAVTILRGLDLPAELSDALIDEAAVVAALGATGDAEQRLVEAADLVDPMAKDTCRRLVRTYCRLRWLEEPNPSTLHADQLVELAERLLDAEADAADAAVLATAIATAGDIRGTGLEDVVAADAAVEAAERSGDDLLIGEAHLARRRALSVHPHRFRERRVDADRAHTLASRLHDHEFLMRAQRMALTDALAAADRERAIGLLEGEPQSAAGRVQQALALATISAVEGRYEDADAILDGTIKELHYLDLEAPALEFVRIAHSWDLGTLGESLAAYERLLPAIADPALRAAVALAKATDGETDVASTLVDETLALFASGAPTILWAVAMAITAETVAAIDHPAAEELYGRLLPFAGECAIAATSAAAWIGAFDRPLGLLALRTGRDAAAADHLRASLTIHERMGARPWAARSHQALAIALERLGDTAGAARHRDEAAAIVAATSMSSDVLVIGDFGTEASPASRSAAPTPSARRRATLVPTGDSWRVGLDDTIGFVRATKGLDYVALLIARPGVDWHAIDLYSGASAEGIAIEGSLGPRLDEQARRAYQARYHELQRTIEEAEANADLGAAEAARDEVEALEQELLAAYGLHGRAREDGDPAEKARVNVQRAIARAIDRIEGVVPDLADHLSRSVRTGRFCRYEPGRTTTIEWTLRD